MFEGNLVSCDSRLASPHLLEHLPSHESWLIFFYCLCFVLHPPFPYSIKKEPGCIHNLHADGFIPVFLN